MSIPWKQFKCGGFDIQGCVSCSNDLCTCKCEFRPHVNYYLNYWFALSVQKHQAHLSSKTPVWSKVRTEIFAPEGILFGYLPLEIRYLRERWNKITSEVTQRHGIFTGFETHPHITPYDNLILKLVKQKELKDEEEDEELEKKEELKEVMKDITSMNCPPLNDQYSKSTIVNVKGIGGMGSVVKVTPLFDLTTLDITETTEDNLAEQLSVKRYNSKKRIFSLKNSSNSIPIKVEIPTSRSNLDPITQRDGKKLKTESTEIGDFFEKSITTAQESQRSMIKLLAMQTELLAEVLKKFQGVE